MCVVAIACGVPRQGEFTTIDRAAVPFDLADTTVPTTTSTTTTTTTVPDASTTTIAVTTTTIPTENVGLYFVAARQVIRTERPLVSPASPPQVLAALFDPPRGQAADGIRTVLPRDAELTVVVDRGTATIDLPVGIFDEIDPRDQRLLFAQLVLTMGQRPAIGQVTFTLGGEPTGAVLGDGSTTEPGALVTAVDYADTLTGAPQATTTTTTTTTAPPPATT
jgi:hypothetical protein